MNLKLEFIIPSICTVFIILSIVYSLKNRIRKNAHFSGIKPTYTVLIPAHNEWATLSSAIKSVNNQTIKPTTIIVLDDYSDKEYTDLTNSSLNVKIFRFTEQRGKSRAVNYALQRIVQTPYVMVLDADTYLSPTYMERIFTEAGDFDVAYGTILPDFRFSSVYTYHRLVENLYTHEITKKAMSVLNALNIAGCAVIYKTETLKRAGGIPMRTLTEDMDLAWMMIEKGKHIVYVERSLAYTLEPASFTAFNRQIHRWYGGFWETLKVHGGKVGDSNGLTFFISIFICDLIIFTPFWIAFLLGSLTLALLRIQPLSTFLTPISTNPFVTLFISTWQRWFPFASNEVYAIYSLLVDISVLVIITLYKARKLKYLRKAFIGLPIFYILNWYSKIVWIKCGIRSLFYKPKGPLTWQ